MTSAIKRTQIVSAFSAFKGDVYKRQVPGVRNLHKIPGSGNEKYRCLDGLQLFFCDLRGMAEERGKLLQVPEEAARKRPMKNG